MIRRSVTKNFNRPYPQKGGSLPWEDKYPDVALTLLEVVASNHSFIHPNLTDPNALGNLDACPLELVLIT